MVADIIPAVVQGVEIDQASTEPDCCDKGCVAPKACTYSGYKYEKCGGKCTWICMTPVAIQHCASTWSGEAFCYCPPPLKCGAGGCY
jgi:hypothetical protein